MVNTASDATTKSTGRPLEFDPEQVLAKVVDLFWREGYRATSMSDLEKATGLTRTSLYNFFGSKADLLERAVDLYYANVGSMMTGPLRDGDRGLDDIDEFFGRLSAAMSDPNMPNGCLVASYVDELASIDKLRETPGRYISRFRESMQKALERAVSRGEIPADSVERRARMLQNAIIGISVAQRAFDGNDETMSALAAIRDEVRSWRED